MPPRVHGLANKILTEMEKQYMDIQGVIKRNL
jgi:hypothetical protein